MRHGQTFENKVEVVQGHLDSRLSPEGFDQALRLSELLKDEKFDCAYSSDLIRAVSTAEVILYNHDIDLLTSEDLREQAKGVYEGKPRAQMLEDMRRLSQEWWNFVPQSGESLSNVWMRVVPFYENLRLRHQYESVLVVSHGGPIACLLSYLHHDIIENAANYVPHENCSVSIISGNNGSSYVERLDVGLCLR